MMSIVLSKSEMVENKEAENRALSRQLEQMQLQLKKAESTWKKVLYYQTYIFTSFKHL